MAQDLLKGRVWGFPSMRFPAFWDDDDDWAAPASSAGGLTVSEDKTHVFVQAAVPGVDPKDIEVTFDKGMLWIKGAVKEEQTDKKFYRKSAGSFSYRVAVPGELDPNREPEASCKNGVMTVAFAKSPVVQPKKITVKTET